MGVSVNGGSIVMGGTPIAGWFIRENPVKMDDVGVPPCQETSICYFSSVLGIARL